MRRAAWLLLALAGGPAWAATTPDGAVADCRRPGSGAERAICARPELQAADLALASLVAEWRQRAPEAALAQQEWLRRRNRMCAPAMRPECLDLAYAERTAWLRETLAALPPAVTTPSPAAPVAVPPVAVTGVPAPLAASPQSQPMPPVAAVPAPSVAPAMPSPPTPPAPRAAGVAVASFAARLASAPCAAVSSTALRGQGWGAGDAPFGQKLESWSRADLSALMRRAAECQAENMDNARNLQLMLNVLNTLRGNAPEAAPPAPPALLPPPRAAAPAAPAPIAAPAEPTPPAALNCADPALLQDVAFTFQAMPGGARIRQLQRPRPYTDVILDAYASSPALRAEYQRLQPYMAPVPQCLVEAETTEGPLTLSYRLYGEGGRMLIEVGRVP